MPTAPGAPAHVQDNSIIKWAPENASLFAEQDDASETDLLNSGDLVLNGLVRSWLQKRDTDADLSFVEVDVSENENHDSETDLEIADYESCSEVSDFGGEAPIYTGEESTEESSPSDLQHPGWQYDKLYSDNSFHESEDEPDLEDEASGPFGIGIKEPQLLRRPIVPVPHAYHHIAAPPGLTEFSNELDDSDSMSDEAGTSDGDELELEEAINPENHLEAGTHVKDIPSHFTADRSSSIGLSYSDRNSADFMQNYFGDAQSGHPIRYRPFKYGPWQRIAAPYQHNYLKGLPVRSVTKTVTNTETIVIPDHTTIYDILTEYADPITETTTISESVISYQTVEHQPSTVVVSSYLTETTTTTHMLVSSITITQELTVIPTPPVPPLFSDMKLFQAIQAPIVRTVTAPCAALESRANLAMRVSAGSIGSSAVAFAALLLQVF